MEGNTVITDCTQICNVFNEHLVNVAQDLCNSDEIRVIRHMSITEIIGSYSEHPSIQLIMENDNSKTQLICKSVTPESVLLKLRQLNVRKACRYDFIKANYRPVSILTALSKLFEGLLWKTLAELVFNVLYNLSPPLPHNLFTKQMFTYDMRNNCMLVQPCFRTMKHGYNLIAYQGAKLWNSLPCHIKVLDNYTSFMLELAKWVAIECKCGTCFAWKF